MLLFGAGRRDRRRRWPAGPSPATACGRYAGSPPPSRRSPGPRTSTRSRSRATTRSPGSPGVQRDARRALGLARPAAPAGRRRRPRAAYAADLAAHQPRPAAQADDRRPGCRPSVAQAELLDDVRAQIEELTTLVGDLVELARDEPLQPHGVEPVDLAEVVDRAVDAGPPPRRQAARSTSTPSPWWVTGEPAALERAVTNLLDNAVKWSPAGRHGHGPARPRHAAPSTTRARASPRPTCRTSSTASTARPSRARMPGSGLGLVDRAPGRRRGTAAQVVARPTPRPAARLHGHAAGPSRSLAPAQAQSQRPLRRGPSGSAHEATRRRTPAPPDPSQPVARPAATGRSHPAAGAAGRPTPARPTPTATVLAVRHPSYQPAIRRPGPGDARSRRRRSPHDPLLRGGAAATAHPSRQRSRRAVVAVAPRGGLVGERGRRGHRRRASIRTTPPEPRVVR